MGTDDVGAQLLELNLQTADADRGGQVLGILNRGLAGDDCLSVGNLCLHGGNADKGAVIVDSDGLAVCVGFLGCCRKLLLARIGEGQLHDNLLVVHGVRLVSRLGAGDICTFQYDVSALLQRGDRLAAGELILIGRTVQRVVVVSVRILLADEVQGSGAAQLLQDGIGIRDTGDLDVDAVGALPVDLCLRGVLLNTALQLVDRIIHVLV